MEGWVDLGYRAMHRPGVEPATFRPSNTLTAHYGVTVQGTNSPGAYLSTVIVVNKDFQQLNAENGWEL